MGRIQASAVSVQNSAVSAAAHLCTLAGNLSGNLSGLRLNSNGIEEEGVHQELEEELEEEESLPVDEEVVPVVGVWAAATDSM